MVNIRSVNDIVLGFIDFYRTSLPEADTKPGSVIRDLFIDAPASQIALLYDELAKVSNLQSLRLVAASDLDRLAQNFGATRKSATRSTGVALLTFASLPSILSINKGDLITANNGATFAVLNGISVDPSQSNFFKSIATKFKNDLSFLNITDPFAVEVSVQATTPGIAGNIGKYTLNRTVIPGVSNVTNVFSFTGGNDQEDDATFRNRVLAIFSGSNLGTALGFRNIALANSAVSDALVIGPGNPLMTRDGTQTVRNADGSISIISEGTGGKVDIVILGTQLTENTDTFIFRDQSNKNDPTDSSNIFVLGQIPGDAGKTITQKRLDDIASSTLPAQPVQEILEVSGSRSGSNFLPKTVDSLGRVSGNFELIKDTGNFAGSPWGSDAFHFVSNKISLFQEDRVKSKFNGQDATTFADVLQIPIVQQNISIANENSLVSSSDRSIIQLLHTPASSVTRVFNLNTGERYVITNQNLDGIGSVNKTGRVQITGNTLPAASDILQVDYTWIVDYDAFSDYDGKILHNNPRPITDSIDWGMASVIRNERILFSLNAGGALYTGTSKLSITSIVSANTFSSSNSFVVPSTVINFTGRLMLLIPALPNPINNIDRITIKNDDRELYSTAQKDGFIVNNRVVVGSDIGYDVQIVFPSDTTAILGDFVNVIYNTADVFNVSSSTGSFVANNITIPASNLTGSSSVFLDTTYIANTPDVLSVGVTSLPISRSGNGFLTNNNAGALDSNPINTFKSENQTIQVNASNQLFVNLSISSNDFSLPQIISAIDLTTKKEIWSPGFTGSIAINNGNYQVIFSGHNTPAVGHNVLLVYLADDLRRVQPFTFANSLISRDIETLSFDFTNKQFTTPIHTFSDENNIQFSIIDPTTGLSLGGMNDGYLAPINGAFPTATAIFSSSSFQFLNITDILGKDISLIATQITNNSGTFSILAFDTTDNTLTIGVPVNELESDQISVIRVEDNKELWDVKACSINPINNQLILPNTINAVQGDNVLVLVFRKQNLHQSPSKLSITVADQVINTGVLMATGTTITKVSDVVFTATSNGLQQNLLEALQKFLNLNSNGSISSNNHIARIMKAEKVNVSTNDDVLNVAATYDVFGTHLLNNTFYGNEMLANNTLENTEFILPKTNNNSVNAPSVGDKIRITFYYATNNDSDSVYFTRNGTLYTNKRFALINQLFPTSGFNASKSARITASYFTQPATGTRYSAFYDYLAPKENERLIIRTNFNKLIADVTLSVENNRPINSDVLVRAAKQLLVDATVNIVVKQEFSASANIVLQNVKDKITGRIDTNKLGDVLNSSDLIVAAQSVDGVDRARILSFNQDGKIGQVLTLTNDADQYFVANTITVNQESR